MERSQEAQNFEQRLKQLVAMARKNKDILEIDTINDFFKELNLDPNQIDKLYEYLESNGIVVMNPNDGPMDDDILLELDDSEEIPELEDLNLSKRNVGRPGKTIFKGNRKLSAPHH